MTRWIVAVAFTTSLALAVPATLTSQPDEPARPSPHEGRAAWERAKAALAHRREELAAGAISRTELAPSTLEALRALALDAALGGRERHPYDGRVYVTTVRRGAWATGDGIPDDRPVFWVMLRGHFVFERHGPPGTEPGPLPTATLISFMVSAKTLQSVGGGYANHDPDTSGLGPATPLNLDSTPQDACLCGSRMGSDGKRARNRALRSGEISPFTDASTSQCSAWRRTPPTSTSSTTQRRCSGPITAAAHESPTRPRSAPRLR
jgi:hypothetical protein